MGKRGPTDWLSVRNMAAEAGLKVDENLLYKLEKESPEQFEIAQRMLSEGRAEYLATEPFFLLLLARTAGFSGTEEEVKALSAQRRVALLEATDMEHSNNLIRLRIDKIAIFVVALVLLSYPFFLVFLSGTCSACRSYRHSLMIFRVGKKPSLSGQDQILLK